MKSRMGEVLLLLAAIGVCTIGPIAMYWRSAAPEPTTKDEAEINYYNNGGGAALAVRFVDNKAIIASSDGKVLAIAYHNGTVAFSTSPDAASAVVQKLLDVLVSNASKGVVQEWEDIFAMEPAR